MTKMLNAGLSLLQWIVGSLLFVALWEMVYEHASSLVVAGPLPVARQIGDWVGNGTVWMLVGKTAVVAVGGFCAGSAAGITLALMCGLLPSIFGKVVEPVVSAFYAVPKFVLVPLILVLMGSGANSRVLLVALAIFAIMFVTTITGIRTVDSDRTLMMRCMGATRAQIALKLLLPHTIGYIATGVGTAAPLAIAYAVGSEILFGIGEGLGGVIHIEAQYYNAKAVLGAVILATVLSACSILVGRWISFRFSGGAIASSVH